VIESSGSALRVLPLGGCGEVGLNATLLFEGDDALLVDCGVLLGVPNAPGVDRAVPGFEPLFRGARRLAGVVLTHGHEDHIGALPALLAELDVPVFGTPLTIALARARLEGLRGKGPVPAEARRQSKLGLQAVPLGGRVTAGPFSIELIRVTHSLPESAALLIETRAGRVFHSGDFKLDPRPFDGLATDVERLKAIAASGIDLMLSDSTNAEVPGRSGSETEVGLHIDKLIGEAKQAVVVACLASHLHRIEGIMRAARRHGRRVALVGRALHEIYKIALAEGQLPADATLLVAEERIAIVPREELVVITTGSQGEAQGGLSRFAAGRDMNLRVGAGDRVIFSARTIPGNERAVRRIVNQLVRQGAEVITDRMEPVHCSGHACQAEQAELLRIVRPRHFVPIHGERAMLEAHRRTAIAEGFDPARIAIIEDGESVVLAHGTIARGDREEVSRRALDPEGRVLDWGDVKDRARIGRVGLVVCSLAVDRRSGQLIDRPAVTTRGLALPTSVMQRISDAVSRALVAGQAGGGSTENLARSAIKQALRDARKDPPEVHVHVLQIEPGARSPA
jgi:ribonuclease J